MRDLTERELMQAIRAANLGGDTIRLAYDSGPYEVSRPTHAAGLLAQAITRKFCEINGIGTSGVSPPFERGSWQHAVDDHLVCYGRTSQEFATPHEAVQWLLQQTGEAAVCAGPNSVERRALELACYGDDGKVAFYLSAAAEVARGVLASQDVRAWEHEEDPTRVISATQKTQALRDGGASASSVTPYSVPLTRGVPGARIDGAQPLPDLIMQLHREGLGHDEIAATLARLGRDSEADAAGISIRAVIEEYAAAGVAPSGGGQQE